MHTLCLVLLLVVALGLGGCGGGHEERLTPSNSLPVRCLDEPEPRPARHLSPATFTITAPTGAVRSGMGAVGGGSRSRPLAAYEETCIAGGP